MADVRDEIKQKLNIVDVVGSYIKLQKAGVNYKALCPFHKEKTPSFIVSPQRQFAHCFGCNFSGDIFTFVMKIENVDFFTALKILANKAGVNLSQYQSKENSIKKTLFEIQEAALIFFEQKLKENTSAYNYLKNRGLSNQIIQEFHIGFAPDEWRSLTEYLISKGFKLSDIEKTGLIIRKNEAANITDINSLTTKFFFDRFRSRIMFPIFNLSNEPAGFTGRIFQADKNIPLKTIKNIEETGKYINSPETIIFNKSTLLFLLNKTKNFIQEKNEAILVEGQMDAIACYQEGVKNVVACSSTALTSEQLNILKRYCSSLILAYDNDQAGQEATERNIELALNADFEVKVITLNDAKDFSEFMNLHPKQLPNIISLAKPIMEFYFNRAQTLFDINTIKGKKDFMVYFLSKIKYLQNNIIEKSFWMDKLSSLLNIKVDLLETELHKLNQTNPYIQKFGITQEDEIINLNTIKTRADILGEKILSSFLHNQDTLKDIVLSVESYFPLQYSNIIKLIKNNKIQQVLKNQSVNDIDTNLDINNDDINLINYLWILGSKDIQNQTASNTNMLIKEIQECAKYLKQEHYKNRMLFLQNKIKELESTGSTAMLQELIKEFKTLTEETQQNEQ